MKVLLMLGLLLLFVIAGPVMKIIMVGALSWFAIGNKLEGKSLESGLQGLKQQFNSR